MRKTLLFALLAVFVCQPSAHAKTLDELLVEKGVITKAEAASVVTNGAAGPKIYWNEGTRIEFPDNGFMLQINAFMKTAYIYTKAMEGQANTSNFDTRSARIQLSGYALNQEFAYKLEYETATNKLLEGYFTWNACKEGEARLGQFKTAISRQFVNSSYKLMFPDASFASNYFNYGYQKSGKITAKMLDGAVTAGLALTNGNSDGEGPFASSVDAKNMLITDLRWNVMGKMNPYEESDLFYTQDPAVNVGAAYAYSPQNTEIGEIVESLNVNRVNVDANLKYQGLGVNAEYYVSNEDPKVADSESWTTQGTYIQAGYFLLPKKFEVAARWSYVNCDDGRGLGLCSGVDNFNQATAGMTYYFWNYDLRVQAAYDYLKQKPVDDESTSQSRWMLQLVGIL